MSEDDQIERAIAQLGKDSEPPMGWQARVLSAIKRLLGASR